MSDINHLGPRYPPNRLSRASFAVYLDWAPGAPSVHVENDNNRVVFGGDWIADVLGAVVNEAITEDLTRR